MMDNLDKEFKKSEEKISKKIFIICAVRKATDEYRQQLEEYAEELEYDGCEVHLPHRDTNQYVTSLGICLQNYVAIIDADEVHIFYNSKSLGTHFDMGMAFALKKPIVVVENEEFDDTNSDSKYKKSFPSMLDEWENEQG